MDSNNSMNNTEVFDIVTCTGGMTINCIVLCHLYGLLKQWVSEESIGPNITTIKPDTDISSNNDTSFIFSTADCEDYDSLTKRYGYRQCKVYNYDTDLHGMVRFTNCFLFFFMTKMGAREKCSNISLGYDNNTKDENAMTLLSKDRILYSFMTDSSGLSDECEKNTTVSHLTDVKNGTSTINICDFYNELVLQNAENTCRPTSEKDTLSNDTTGGILHYECVWYRLLTELGARKFCDGIDNTQTSCEMYDFVTKGIIGGSISIIGIVCNIGSLVVFRHRVIKTPTTYQLQWLALVDTIFLVLYFVCVTSFYMVNNFQIDQDNLYLRVIDPYVMVYVRPVWHIARTSTNWLMVFIGVYRYLTICKPVSYSYHHVEQHRQQYVALVHSMAVFCNIPYFFVFNLSQDDENNVGYVRTSIGENDLFKLVYRNIMHPACIYCVYLFSYSSL